MTNRTLVYIGTPVDLTPEIFKRACTLAKILYDKGFLPITPFMYQKLYGPTPQDYRWIRAELFKQCKQAICLGTPTGDDARMMEASGVVPRVI